MEDIYKDVIIIIIWYLSWVIANILVLFRTLVLILVDKDRIIDTTFLANNIYSLSRNSWLAVMWYLLTIVILCPYDIC